MKGDSSREATLPYEDFMLFIFKEHLLLEEKHKNFNIQVNIDDEILVIGESKNILDLKFCLTIYRVYLKSMA